MNEFNLLYPVGTEPAFHKLSETTCNDLSLDYILSYVAKSDYERNIMKGIMTAVESNPEVIRYRRDIFEDFMRFPSFKDGIRYSLDQLDYMKTLGRSFNDDAIAPLWQLVNRLQELDVYINCISDIHAALKNVDIRSEGLRKLRDHVASIYNDCGFEYLKADIKELITETSQIQSITLGINLDETMRPVEVGIMSINKKKFDHSNILDNFIGFLSQLGGLLDGKSGGESFNGMSKLRSSGATASDNPLMQNLSREVSDMLSSTVKHLKNKLSRYVDISGYGLTKFIPEFTFYIRWADFCTEVLKSGLPMAKPEILDVESKELTSKGIYNLKLAVKTLAGDKLDVVRNDFGFSREHGIYIMTGPSRGLRRTACMSLPRRSACRPVTISSRIFPLMKTKPSTSAVWERNRRESVRFLRFPQQKASSCSTNLSLPLLSQRACISRETSSRRSEVSAQERYSTPICTSLR